MPGVSKGRPGLWRALARPVARTVPWRAIGAAGGLGLLLATAPRLVGEDATGRLALNVLRVSAVAFALGAAFLLDDPARHTTAAVPARRAVRHTLRFVLVLPVAVSWWTAALLLVPAGIRPPVAGVTLEAAAVLALALAGAAFAVRRSDSTRPGQAVAGALFASAVLACLLWPERWALFVAPDDERWAAAHDRWTVLLCAALAVWAVCGAEPVRRWRGRAALRSLGS
ncbi:ABC transporter [Streptomyces sp. NEAU-W12]|uniref:ABC transporter n=1 Tax=Streptomyces sp. NEAU-W12 TaxID=2994668 RepID=UPI00224B15AF|nr:ABC transporter [Streptomyces sp. NEAU-W12]MCX2927513.1 ABC transporter [Streptomyces sp. NEAU-W12]